MCQIYSPLRDIDHEGCERTVCEVEYFGERRGIKHGAAVRVDHFCNVEEQTALPLEALKKHHIIYHINSTSLFNKGVSSVSALQHLEIKL